MSRIEPKNMLENFLQTQATDNRSNSLDFESSPFLKMFKKDSKEDSGKNTQIKDVLEQANTEKLQQQVLHELTKNFSVNEKDKVNINSKELLQILASAGNQNEESALDIATLTEKVRLIEETFAGLVDNIKLQGEYKIQASEIVNLTDEKLHESEISNLHKILNNVFSEVFSYDEQSQSNVFVSSKEDDKQSVLQIWVPLTSIATGKLAQSSDSHLAVSLYQQLNPSLQSTTTQFRSEGYSSQLGTTSSQIPQASKTNQSNANLSLSATGAKVTNSVAQEIKRTGSLHYASATAQAAQEILSKKYTFFYNDDGMTIWYRDYESSEEFIEQRLNQIKALIEKHSQIKTIGYNGKILYSNDSQAANLGEEYAS